MCRNDHLVARLQTSHLHPRAQNQAQGVVAVARAHRTIRAGKRGKLPFESFHLLAADIAPALYHPAGRLGEPPGTGSVDSREIKKRIAGRLLLAALR